MICQILHFNVINVQKENIIFFLETVVLTNAPKMITIKARARVGKGARGLPFRTAAAGSGHLWKKH